MPECLSSDKENLLPLESVTPPSSDNLSLEEGAICNENEAPTSEANVANAIMTTPRASSPYPDWPGTLEQIEPKTDDEIIEITDYSEGLANDKRSLWPNQKHGPNSMTQGPCPTPQTSPSYLAMNVATGSTKPHCDEIWGILPEKRKTPHGWPACLKKQPPRAAFWNNDIYVVNNGEESNHYEEPQERNVRVFYKLKVNENPASKNVPHEEEYNDNNYESIEEKETAA